MLTSSRLNLKQRALVQLINPFKTLIQSIGNRTRANEEQLVIKAFEVFQDKKPKWAESCFDIYFLTSSGKEALESQDAEALAKAYLAQLCTVDIVKNPEKLEIAKSVAQEFLTILAFQRT